MSGKRIYPLSSTTSSITSIPNSNIVYVDDLGNVVPLGIGTNLSVDMGFLNVTSGGLLITKSQILDFAETDYVHVTNNETIAGNKTFTGNVYFNGTVTQIESVIFEVGDAIIVLNNTATGTPVADAGIEVERGISDNVQLLWDESLDKWGMKYVTAAFVPFSLEGHVHNFSSLTDVPSTYAAQALKVVRVKSDETGLEFVQIIDTDSTFAANSDLLVPSQKAVKSAMNNLTTSIGNIVEVYELTSEPTGFVDRTDSDISFDNLTRTFSLTTTTGYDYYIKGVKYTVTTDKTITIPDVDGSYFFFLDTNETLSYVTAFDTALLHVYAFIASVNWSTTQSKILGLAEERHGTTMDWATHSYLHTYVGARIRPNDFPIGNFVLSGNGSNDTHCKASFGNGVVTDEDLNHTITHSATPTLPFEQVLLPIAELPIMHKIGSDTWYMDDPTTDLVKTGTSRIQFNLFSGTWSAVDATDLHYVAMWVFATNFRDSPIRVLLGQREDATLNEASTNNTYEALDLTGLAIQEYKILYRLIFQTSNAYTNTQKARLVQVFDLRKSMDQGQTVTTATNNHALLVGLGNDDHIHYHNDLRGDLRYYTKFLLDAGQLDNRYYTEAETDIFLSGKSNTGHIHSNASSTNDGFMSITNFDKLATIESFATANETDSFLLSRTNHSGTQDVSTITGLVKSSVGLGNVDNTSDADKPISLDTQDALDLKVDIVSGKQLSTNDFSNYYKLESETSTYMADELGSSVNVSGGVVSLTGGVTFSISPGVGYTRDNTGKLVRVAWPTLTGACTGNGDNFINIDYLQNVVITSSAAQGDVIALGYIRTGFSNTQVVGFSNTRLKGYNHLFEIGEFFRSSIGSLVQAGCNTAMQATPNDLKLTVASGFIWSLFNRFTIPDTSTFTKLINTADYGFIPESTTTANTVNTDYINVPTNNAATALVPMTTNYYKKDLIALTPEGTVFYVYATTEWPTLDDAKSAPVPAAPENINLSIVRSAAIVTKQGATTIETLLDIRPMFSRLFDTGQAASNATVISHSDLTDLGADDHGHYHNDARGDLRYYRKTELDSGALNTLYNTKSEITTFLLGKSNVGHTHVSANITDLSPTTVGLGNVPNVDATNASNITSGTLPNSRLTSNLSEIAGITKVNGGIISVVGGVYAARTISQYKTDLSLNNVVNVDTSNASNISTGTLSNARLTSNLLDIGNLTLNNGDYLRFNGTNVVNVSVAFVKTDLALTKSDVGLSAVANVDTTNASNISTGTLSNDRLSTNLSQIGALVLATNDYLQFNGSDIVNVTPSAVKSSLSLVKADVGLSNVPNTDATNASNISTGTLSNSRLTANLTQLGNITFATNDFIQYNGITLVKVTPSSVKTSLSLVKGDVGLGNVANVDTTNASNITTGTLPISVLPAGALERLVIVANQTARFALTTATVQNGDTVKQNDTGIMYYVVDDANLSNSAGYETYTAGAATSVPYSGVTSIPSNISQLGGITFTTNDIPYFNGTIVTNISPSSYKALLSLSKTDVGLSNVVNSLQVINAGNGTSFASGTNASKPVAGTNGRLFATTDSGIFLDNGTSWILQQAAITGDISISANSSTATLATVNSNIGTFNNVTVNGKGLVTAASNVSYLTANQTITVSGDMTGSGTTGLALTLATVNSNIGTFNNVTVNGKGLVTAASNVSYLTGNQSISLSGDFTGSGTTAITGTLATVNSNVGTFGSTTVVPVITVNAKGLTTSVTTATLTNASVGLGNVANSLQVINAGGVVSAASGTNAAKPAAGTSGRFYTSTDQGIIYFDNGTTWNAQLPAYTGDVTSSLGATSLTLATVNSNIGTFNNVTVNDKGLVTAASNVAYITGNQSITLSGDFTGSGTTAITGTLATVNSNIGTFNNVTVNGKGLVTAASNVAYITGNQSITLSGDLTGSGTTAITMTLATVNSNVGTFNNVTVNGKGLVTAASNVSYLTSNQTITVSGDLTGSGTTGLALTLATVNSNIGTFNNITVNAKGLVTAASNVAYITGNQSITLSGDFTGSGTTAITGTLATVNSNVGTFNNVTINAKGLATSASNVDYLLDPAANGIVVRTAINTTTNRTLTGTANQTSITNGDGVAGNPTIAIASNPVLPGTASTTIPIGTTAERDTATNGQLRFNSTLGYAETSSNNVYHPLGKVIQFISGDIIQTTGTTILPYDATLPTSTEGFQIWTANITPTYTTSTIVIIFNVYAECSAALATATLALYNGTTAISIAAGRGVTANTAMNLSISKRFVSGTISPITLSARIGPSAAATVYVNRGNTETFGGTTTSSYIIMEII